MAYSVGIEYEMFVLDSKSLQPVALAKNRLHQIFGQAVKPEYYNCQIELNTEVCPDIKNLKSHFSSMLETSYQSAEKAELTLLNASTHPTLLFKDCKMSKDDRLERLDQKLQEAVHRLLTCSLQIHVAVPHHLRIPIINIIRPFLPHMLALSTSSPFWESHNSGFMSYRTLIMENLPCSGLPPEFSCNAEFERYSQILQKSHFIENDKEIWWDIRPHPFFPTLECRICDTPQRVADIIALAALFQALVVKACRVLSKSTPVPSHKHQRLFDVDNKWQAARYGLEGTFIDWQLDEGLPVQSAIEEMLKWINEVVDELGSRNEINHIYTIMEQKTSAHQQIKLYKQSNDLKEVIKSLLLS